MGTAIAVAWGIVLFAVGCIVAIVAVVVLILVAISAWNTVRAGLRHARGTRDAVEKIMTPPTAQPPVRPVPRPSNVTSIMRHEDQ